MAQPLLATWRAVVKYIVSGQTHTFHAYMNSTGAVGGGFILNICRDATTQSWRSSVQGLADSIANGIASSGSWGTAELQKLVGGLWQVQDTYTPSGAMGGGTLVPAEQITLVLRDTAFKKIRATVLDGGAAIPAHYASEAAIPASPLKNMVAGFTPTGGNTTDPFFWQYSRGARYISPSAFVGVTTDLNNKVRRARGLT